MNDTPRTATELKEVPPDDLAILVKARRLLLEAGKDTKAIDQLLGLETVTVRNEVGAVLDPASNVVADPPAPTPAPKPVERRRKKKVEDTAGNTDPIAGAPTGGS